MKKVNNAYYGERYVEETLDNGLHVVLWQKEDYTKSLFLMATPLGAIDMKQIDDQGKEYSFPAGIAHFLEHKMFEMDECDVMDRFSQLGASVNAFTSYTDTAYYFSTTSDVKEPLNLLMDFVQDLTISEKSVEKEKGIIIQELNMYKQMPDNRLLMETFSSLYKNHPLRFDIGGDDESVTSITLEQLQECYKLNYHPSKMVLIGVSSQDPEELLHIIRENQQAKTFESISNIKRKKIDEPMDVFREKFQFQMDVSEPKIAVAYKCKGIEHNIERMKAEWCVKILLDVYFTSLNPDYQTWLDESIINDFVGCEVDFGDDYGMVLFYAETSKADAFLQVVEQVVANIHSGHIDEDVLRQLKRRYYGQSIRSLNSFDDIAITYARSYFDNIDFFETMNVIEQITKDMILEVCSKLNFDKKCVVELTPEK